MTLQQEPDTFPLEALVSCQFSSQISCPTPEPNPALASVLPLAHHCCQQCFQLPGPPLGLDAFWKCQLNQWVPTGTGDQIWEPISGVAWEVSSFFDLLLHQYLTGLNPTVLKNYSKHLLIFFCCGSTWEAVSEM